LVGDMKILAWTLIGLVVGIVFGLVWRLFEPSLALYFWPLFGAVIFGQHAYRSHRDKEKPKPPTTRYTE
jgi:hypothetical protein